VKITFTSVKEKDIQFFKENLKILKLSTLDNVIITPHIAYYTEKAINNIRKYTVECINLFIKEKKPGRFEVV